jgi:hypothetical protein
MERLYVDKKSLPTTSGRLSRRAERHLRDNGRQLENTKPTAVRSMTLPVNRETLHAAERRTSRLGSARLERAPHGGEG